MGPSFEAEGRSVVGRDCPLSSARPLSVRLSFFHRPLSDSGAVGGDEVTHSNANAARGVVSLGRTEPDGRSGRSVARSLIRRHAAGRKWWKLGIWRTSTRDDRSIDCRYLQVIHSLVGDSGRGGLMMQIGFWSLASLAPRQGSLLLRGFAG